MRALIDIRTGFSADAYNNLKYIASDEQTHVQVLTGALEAAGVTPAAACAYNFPYTDVFVIPRSWKCDDVLI